MPEFLKGQQSFIAVVVVIAVILVGGIIIFNNRDQGEVTEEAASQSGQVEQKEAEIDDLKSKIEEAAPEDKEDLQKQLDEKESELQSLSGDVITQLQDEIRNLTEEKENASDEEKESIKNQISEKQAELDTLQEEKISEEEETGLPTKYTVAKGDHLWAIATKFYNDGYKWTVLAAENNIQNPDIILPGQKLTVPEVRDREYIVVKGDTLWGISERFYGSGFSWKSIQLANTGQIGRLPNGNPLIKPGQILKIP